MKLEEINWGKEKPFKAVNIRLQPWRAFFDGKCTSAIGVDPGKNFGITVVDPPTGLLWCVSGKFEVSGLVTFWDWRALISELGWYIWAKKMPVVIEGASYNEHFGQVELAEIRLSIRLAFHMAGFGTILVPPQSARKQVFGSAKIHGHDFWPTLNPNAADSVPLAFVAGGYNAEETSR